MNRLTIGLAFVSLAALVTGCVNTEATQASLALEKKRLYAATLGGSVATQCAKFVGDKYPSGSTLKYNSTLTNKIQALVFNSQRRKSDFKGSIGAYVSDKDFKFAHVSWTRVSGPETARLLCVVSRKGSNLVLLDSYTAQPTRIRSAYLNEVASRTIVSGKRLGLW